MSFNSPFLFLYNVLVHLLTGFAWIVSPFDRKISAVVAGRKNLLYHVSKKLQTNKKPIAWIHCASLGEFEQGRPVIEQLRNAFPSYAILITFFSPSGYEACKNYEQVDFVFYLPWDTSTLTRQFITAIKPVFVLFVKYEFWFNLMHELSRQEVPFILISAVFRKDQFFFKPYGFFTTPFLRRCHHFFVQDHESKQRLHSIGINQVTVAGDTRVDRVYQIAKETDDDVLAKQFQSTSDCVVIGSCWPEDFNLLMPFINEYKDQLKFIIAPHEISESFLSSMENRIEAKSIRYSQAGENVHAYSVLFIDNIGLLSKLYRYGKFAYVGGAFGKGLHNILEPACYGIPVFFGNRQYKKFREATDLMQRGAAYTVGNHADLISRYTLWVSQPKEYEKACREAQSYVVENMGATKKIITYCRSLVD